MTDLRAKIERAVAKANELVPGSRVDTRWASDFLRALEDDGLKLMDGEMTLKMKVIGGDLMSHTSLLQGADQWARFDFMFREAFAAAPTLADRLKEEK